MTKMWKKNRHCETRKHPNHVGVCYTRFTVLLFCCLLFQSNIVFVYSIGQSCENLFPSREEEYDPFFFNPDNMFGAPYGGYARATRSRLAALPLRLVVDDDDDNNNDNNNNNNNNDDTTITSTKKSDNNNNDDDDDDDDDDDLYYTYRDGLGRLFACHLYDEEELKYRSTTDSMFNQATEAEPIQQPEPPPNRNDVPGTESTKDATQQQTTTSTNAPTETNDPISLQSNDASSSSDDRMQITKEDIQKKLKKLKGVCSQIHTGWWSYEWCHENTVTQFHVHVENGEKDSESKAKGSPPISYEIQTVTNLGRFSDRRLLDTKKSNNDQQDMIQVQDNFYGGDWCEQSKSNRSVKVNLRCCTQADLAANNNLIRKLEKKKQASNRKEEAAYALFVDLQESLMCRYEAQICTPLLCTDSFPNKSPKSVDRDRVYAQDMTTDPIHFNNDELPTTTINKEDSIRDILQWTLGKKCLYKKVGWWTYEFCYGRQLLQFHESSKMDQKTGFMTVVKETKHYLGHYDVDVLEGFPKEDEDQYIAWPQSKKENQLPMTQKKNNYKSLSREQNNNENDNQYSLKMQKLIKENALAMDTTDLDAGGSGAVFIQEYFHGDYCEHPDVTKSFIKGGSVSEGGIERSTTVRYSCGNNREFIKVNEDSTCHYIVDITLPELCKHHQFIAPVVKTKVVKCLLVDEQPDNN